jgi:glyoxylase-like metal-dependent hydrolase (beta-lactamase superfamily II)
MKEIASNIYTSTELPGVNVGFVILPAGAIAVDAPTLPHHARAWRRQVEETAGGPILYVVLTDAHPDRLLSAGLLGAPLVAARGGYDRAAAYTDGFWRGIVDSWGRRYPEAADELADVSIVLPEIMFSTSITLHKGGEDVTVRHVVGAGPGSAWLHLHDQDVLFAGDTLIPDSHPFLHAAPDTKAWLNTLTALRRAHYAETIIVPGRGPLCSQEDTRPLSDYIALARRRARSMHAAGEDADVAAVVTEMLPLFPFPDDQREQVMRRIKAGIERVYEELGTG